MPMSLRRIKTLLERLKTTNMESLFQDDWGENNEPIDNTQITTTLLYFSEPELKEFKRLCRVGFKDVFGDDYISKGNMSDFLLTILKQRYENI